MESALGNDGDVDGLDAGLLVDHGVDLGELGGLELSLGTHHDVGGISVDHRQALGKALAHEDGLDVGLLGHLLGDGLHLLHGLGLDLDKRIEQHARCLLERAKKRKRGAV